MSKELLESIVNKNYEAAQAIFENHIGDIVARKLTEAKKMVAAKMSEQGLALPSNKLQQRGLIEDELDEMDVSKEKPEHDSIEDRRKGQIVQDAGKTSQPGVQNTSDEGKGDLKTTVIKKMNEEELDEARIAIVKARIRGGKVQRRKRVSNVPGMTLRGGKLKRMSPAERRRRKLGQKRGKLKRRSKMRMAIMKRKRSLRKRAAIGL